VTFIFIMSVLKPELVWVGDSCFRKNPVEDRHVYFGRGDPAPGCGDTADAYDDYEDGPSCMGGGGQLQQQSEERSDEYRESNFEVVLQDNGMFCAKLRVAAAFYPFLIGKKGATKKRLENETRAKVTIPRQGVENEAVVISGRSRSDVLQACERVELMVESSRRKMGFTHFLSIPLNTARMQESFVDFRTKVLEHVGGVSGVKVAVDERRIDETVFQTPSLLHLTIGVLALMDDYERDKARALLEDCKESLIRPILGSDEMFVDIRNLEIMNDDPAEVDVVYAKIAPGDTTDRLQRVADSLVDRFVHAGLMARQYDRVKLHVTVLNSLYRNKLEDEFEGYKEGAPRVKMDARTVLSEFGHHDFGSAPIREFHLSQRRAGRRTEENYYFPSTIVKL